MATSGSVNFSMTRNEIITDALEQISVLGEGETPSGPQLTKANRALNRIIKAFENSARHIWKLSEATLFTQVNQEVYTLGAGSTDHCTEHYVSTTLSGDEALGQTVLSVTSSTGMTAADYVGIVLDNDTIHWTTIVSVDSSTQITITLALASAAASGNNVYSYTTKINKPLDIVNARLRLMSTSIDIDLTKIDYDEYFRMPNKITNGGTTISWMFHRLNLISKFYVYPIPINSTHTINFSYFKPIEDFDSAGDTPDFPAEWYDYFVLALAIRLSPSYGILSTDEYVALQGEANAALMVALSFDNSKGAIRFSPDIRNG